jgi:hypothetical protein
LVLIPEGDGADEFSNEGFRGKEHDVSWWVIPAMITFDVYVMCLAIVIWAVKSAPLVQDSRSL